MNVQCKRRKGRGSGRGRRLEEMKKEEVDMAGGNKKEGADAVTLPQVRVLVFGDNRVRHLVRFAPERGSVGQGCVSWGLGQGR